MFEVVQGSATVLIIKKTEGANIQDTGGYCFWPYHCGQLTQHGSQMNIIILGACL